MKILNLKKINKKKFQIYFEEIRNIYNFLSEKNLNTSKKLVDAKEHYRWYSKIKKKDLENILIAVEKKKLLGYVRTKKYYNNFIISIAVKPKSENKGIGTLLLKKVIKKSNSNSSKFIAIIKKENEKSIKFFYKNSFVKYETDLKLFKNNIFKNNVILILKQKYL